jgi:hypothetical protein
MWSLTGENNGASDYYQTLEQKGLRKQKYETKITSQLKKELLQKILSVFHLGLNTIKRLVSPSTKRQQS